VIALIATYRAAPGEVATVADLISRMVAPSRAERGCRAYVPHRSPEDPTEFLLYEQYTDHDALEAHRTSSHFVDIVQGQIVPRLESRTVAVYELLSVSST
jgi:quinol monooxygenase YgiN